MLPANSATRRLGPVFHRHPARKIEVFADGPRRSRLLLDGRAASEQQADPDKCVAHDESCKIRVNRWQTLDVGSFGIAPISDDVASAGGIYARKKHPLPARPSRRG